MNELKITRGEWQSLCEGCGNYKVVSFPDGKKVVICLLATYSKERDANGFLIAAAPNMYEALVYSMNIFKSIGLEKAVTYIANVIKKARGELTKLSTVEQEEPSFVINETNTTDEILEDIRKRFTPKDDKYGAPKCGVLRTNCGWIAFCDDYDNERYTDETFKSSKDAALNLWNHYYEKIWSKQNKE